MLMAFNGHFTQKTDCLIGAVLPYRKVLQIIYCSYLYIGRCCPLKGTPAFFIGTLVDEDDLRIKRIRSHVILLALNVEAYEDIK